MKKKIWAAVGGLCAVFLLLGAIQGIRHPELVEEALQIIAGYELDFSEESAE